MVKMWTCGEQMHRCSVGNTMWVLLYGNEANIECAVPTELPDREMVSMLSKRLDALVELYTFY